MLAIALGTSFAWFYQNSEVDTNQTRVMSSSALTAFMNSTLITSEGYNGETGVGAPNTDDAPYVAQAAINVTSQTANQICTLSIVLNNFVATHGSLEDEDSYLLQSNKSSEYFTIRLIDIDDNEYYIDSENIVTNINTDQPYVVLDGENKFSLRIIYLPQNSYLKWEVGNYDYNPSNFSDFKYAGAKFYFTLNCMINLR
jgi:hypothetical protein